MALTIFTAIIFDRYRGILGNRDKYRLSEIGRSISRYNRDFRGAFPTSISELIRTERLDPHLAECDAGLPLIGRPGAFIYLGRDLAASTAGSETVVAYAPASDNAGVGTDVLFGDGHVDWVVAADLPAVLARGGPVTRPATVPTK